MIQSYKYSLVLMLSLSMWGTCSLYGQRFSNSDPRRIRIQYKELLQHESDSTIFSQQIKLDSLVHGLEEYLHTQISVLKHLTDSLVSAAGDSLDPARRDSAFHISTQLSGTLRFHTALHYQKLDSYYHQHQLTLQTLKENHSACASCEEAGDFEDELSTFLGEADSVNNVFSEKASLFAEEGLQSLCDSASAFQDSVMNYISTLMDNRQNELEYIEEHSTKLIFSFDSRTPYSYLGRDDGIRQTALNPSITFLHSSGFYATVGEVWMDQKQNPWNGTGVGIGYNFIARSSLNGSLTFSDFWSKDSTSQQQYSFSQIIDAQISYESSLINVSANFCLNTSVGSDFGITLGCSHRWEWRFGSFEPTLSAVWGKQEWDADELILTPIRKIVPDPTPGNPNRVKVVTVNDSSWTSINQTAFSIMGYQIDFPINIRIGRGVLTPTLSYIIPIHVLDDSNRKSFFAFGLTFMIDWLL